MFTLVHYLDASGRDYYQDWLNAIRDRQAKIAILRRIARLECGLQGDHKSLRGGVQELRVDMGAGYRIYYALVGNNVILLACGGSKRSQDQDIELAIRLLRDWKKRNG